jgi:hypothetical protein
MDPEHQSILIGVIVLLLIINTTAVFSLASDRGMLGSGPSPTPAVNKTAGNPTATATQNPALVSPTVSSKNTTTSNATPAKSSNTTAGSVKTSSPVTSNASRYRTYTNESYTFSLDYPANWTMAEMSPALLKTINATRLKSETGIRVVEFYSPSIIRCDSSVTGDCAYIRTKVSVDVAYLPANMTFDEYFINRTLAMTDDNSVGMRRASPVITLNYTKAYSLEYNSGYNEDQAYVTKIFGLFGGRVYMITYRSNFPKINEENQFEKYSGDFQHMLKSFAYTGSLRYL